MRPVSALCADFDPEFVRADTAVSGGAEPLEKGLLESLDAEAMAAHCEMLSERHGLGKG